jgi:5'-nucleotidase (lipoprotein e(P4) family)
VCATRCKPILVCPLVAMLAIACSAETGSVAQAKSGDAPAAEQSPAATARPLGSHEMLNAALWQQTSAEYEAAARQAYRLARVNLDLALEDPAWSAVPTPEANSAQLPPAVMLDLDETVFDNARYEARIILEYGKYTSETFSQWCEEGAASAVPGATEFLRYAAGRSVAIIYFSARSEKLRACTLRNLERLELPIGTDANTLLLRAGGGKEEHRREIALRYRVLLILGDNLDDFVDGSQTPADERRRLAQRHADRWGSKWIILPNAMYGHWEAAFFDFDYRLPRSELLKRKLEGLRK